jgi:hypothetical protein
MLWKNCLNILNFISQVIQKKSLQSNPGIQYEKKGKGGGKGEFGMGNGAFKGVVRVGDSTGYPVSFTEKNHLYLTRNRSVGFNF